MSPVGHIQISFKPVLIRKNSNKNRVTLDLHQAKADKPEDQWLKEKKFQHKWCYYRKVPWLKHGCWMLSTVGLIQHLCKSKAISHLLQHLRIGSTAGKNSETESSFSCTTARVWSAWDFSEGIPDLCHGAKKESGPIFCFLGVSRE